MHICYKTLSLFSRWLYMVRETYALRGACAGKRAGAHARRNLLCTVPSVRNRLKLYLVHQSMSNVHAKNNKNAETTPERAETACARTCGDSNTLPTILETVDLALYGPNHSESIIFAKKSRMHYPWASVRFSVLRRQLRAAAYLVFWLPTCSRTKLISQACLLLFRVEGSPLPCHNSQLQANQVAHSSACLGEPTSSSCHSIVHTLGAEHGMLSDAHSAHAISACEVSVKMMAGRG